MNMLCRKHNTKKTTSNDNEDLTKKRKNPMLIPERKDCETVLRALQRKRLNGWIDESEFMALHLHQELDVTKQKFLSEKAG